MAMSYVHVYATLYISYSTHGLELCLINATFNNIPVIFLLSEYHRTRIKLTTCRKLRCIRRESRTLYQW